MVPVCVVKLDESTASFNEPPSQQTVSREARFSHVLDAVVGERFFRLARQVHQLGSAALHAVRHFVRGNPRGDFRIADLVEPCLIEIFDGVDEFALSLLVETLW